MGSFAFVDFNIWETPFKVKNFLQHIKNIFEKKRPGRVKPNRAFENGWLMLNGVIPHNPSLAEHDNGKGFGQHLHEVGPATVNVNFVEPLGIAHPAGGGDNAGQIQLGHLPAMTVNGNGNTETVGQPVDPVALVVNHNSLIFGNDFFKICVATVDIPLFIGGVLGILGRKGHPRHVVGSRNDHLNLGLHDVGDIDADFGDLVGIVLNEQVSRNGVGLNGMGFLKSAELVVNGHRHVFKVSIVEHAVTKLILGHGKGFVPKGFIDSGIVESGHLCSPWL